MTQRNLTSVLLKVLGVVCIIKAVDFLSQVIMILVSMFSHLGKLPVLDYILTLIPVLIPLLFLLIPAFILLRYARQISARFFQDETPAFPGDASPTDRWYVFAFTILGAVLLVWYVPLSLGRCLSLLLWPTGDLDGPFRREMRTHLWR